MGDDRGGGPTLTRRTLLRAAGGVALVGGLAWGAVTAGPHPTPPGARVVVREACAGCTGCVAACPTSAIAVRAGGITVIEERCNSCGYCATICPVGGIGVHRHDGGSRP